MAELSDDFRIGGLTVSPQHNTMRCGDNSCRLQPKTMALLNYLATHKDRVINNEELLETVWQGRVVTHNSIQKCVNALRAAFAELDDSADYVVYFSKRGYQLVIPKQDEKITTKSNRHSFKIILAVTAATLLSLLYLFSGTFGTTLSAPTSNTSNLPIFTQVKPFVSNTGREKIIAPHFNSSRVAFVRNENSGASEQYKSHLYIKNAQNSAWQVSIARGNYVLVSWSASGRNLVVVDAHYDEQPLTDLSNNALFYTFHIYTFDFKAEKVIEKNTLSHWRGKVSSVTWWDETTLDFTASQGKDTHRIQYRYRIADQNLSSFPHTDKHQTLLSTQTFAKKTAKLYALNLKEHIQVLDAEQDVIGEWGLPFKVKSMAWLADEKGLLLLTENNQLWVMHLEGSLRKVKYSPKVNGLITHVSSIADGQRIVFNVEPFHNITEKNKRIVPNRFLNEGGGFIYSAANNN